MPPEQSSQQAQAPLEPAGHSRNPVPQSWYTALVGVSALTLLIDICLKAYVSFLIFSPSNGSSPLLTFSANEVIWLVVPLAMQGLILRGIYMRSRTALAFAIAFNLLPLLFHGTYMGTMDLYKYIFYHLWLLNGLVAFLAAIVLAWELFTRKSVDEATQKTDWVPHITALDAAPSWSKVVLLIGSFALYFGSLALPAVTYEPSLYSNPKYGQCPSDTGPNKLCYFASVGRLQCVDREYLKISNQTVGPALTQDQIADYCAGSTVPLSRTDKGIDILEMGAFGFLLGIFAWFANLFGFLALFFTRAKTPGFNRAGLSIALLAFAVGLDSFSFDSYPLDEGVVKSLTVAHLNVGFYVWELSFLVLAAYFYVRYVESKRFIATAPPEAVAAVHHSGRRWLIGILSVIIGWVVISNAYQWYVQKQQAPQKAAQKAYVDDLYAPMAVAPAGVLVPTAQSVPAGFIKIRTAYTKGGYYLTFRSATTTYVTMIFSEPSADNKDQTYESATSQYKKLNPNDILQDFTFQGAPGFVHASHTVMPAGQDNYHLFWNDQGKPVEIQIIGMPPDVYPTVDSVVAILGTLQRN